MFLTPGNNISLEEFGIRVKKGEKLVILDDLVLDVGKYRFAHPGGKFVIEHNIGEDISKFFYGGYSLEIGSGHKPYTHSNVARNVVNSLIIGQIIREGPSFTCELADRNSVN